MRGGGGGGGVGKFMKIFIFGLKSEIFFMHNPWFIFWNFLKNSDGAVTIKKNRLIEKDI